MKKFLSVLTALFLFLIMTSCTEPEPSDENHDNTENNTQKVTLYLMFEAGLDDGYSADIEGDITPEKLLDALSAVTGYSFSYSSVKITDNDIMVAWSDSAAFQITAGEQKGNDDYRFYDFDSMLSFILDSSYGTLKTYFPDSDIYFGNPDGAGLSFINESNWEYPGNEPYSGDFYGYYINEQEIPIENIEYPYQNPRYPELNDSQRELYDELYGKIVRLEAFSYDAETYGYAFLDDVYVVWNALSADHPEINNYFSISEITDDTPERLVASLDSCYYCRWAEENRDDKENIRAGIDTFEKECDNIIGSMPDGLSALDKYKYLAEQLSMRATYDYGTVTLANTCAYGALINGSAVCQGYAEAYQYLCMKANLWCVQVEGASNDVGHVWNLVKLSTGTYYIDVTWADINGESNGRTLNKYMFLTQEELLSDHRITDGTVASGTEHIS